MNLSDLLLNDLSSGAMDKSQFYALREQRKRQSSGSGSIEWGKHLPIASLSLVINQGMFTFPLAPSAIYLGNNDSDAEGTSRTDSPLMLVNGVQHKIRQVNNSTGGWQNTINFSPAPDGTKTYDIATSIATQHADSATAFGAETATNKVITSRKDLVLLETWHEIISSDGGADGNIDQVHYLGAVQSGLAAPYGYNLPIRDDGYTRFGEWDSTTTGRYALWSGLTLEQKLEWVADQENNIYYDIEINSFVQVKQRIRVIEGLGDEWLKVSPKIGTGTVMQYQGTSYVGARGSDATALDFNSDVFVNDTDATYNGSQVDSGLWSSRNSLSETKAHNGLCFAVPIALVQRLNQGAYHPVYNTQGCSFLNDTGATGNWKNWYESDAAIVHSTSDVFANTQYGLGFIGAPAIGRTDPYEFYDAIYAGLVEDLRLNANKLDLNKLHEDSKRSDVAGTTRGIGKVPFTKVFSSVGAVEAGYTIVNQDNTNAVVAQKELTAEYDSLPYVNIIGDPSNILATFPDGVIGSWVSTIPDNTTRYFDMTRNSFSTGFVNLQHTVDNGVTWTGYTTLSIDPITNQADFNGLGAAEGVSLVHYESLSDFTESSANSKVLGPIGDVYCGAYYEIGYGNRLMPSLIGQVSSNSSSEVTSSTLPVTQFTINTDGTLSGFNLNAPSHENIPLRTPLNNSHAVKSLTTIAEKDGLLYAQYHAVELIYDGSSFVPWGDNSTIPIVNNESTITDLNGSVVKAVCHIGKIPIGIANYNDGGI